MHTKILKDATDEQLKEFVHEFIYKLKTEDPDIYKEAEMDLYEKVYGPHFTEWMLEDAVKNLKNEDGSTGPHWSVEDTDAVAREAGISFVCYNKYDWNFVMNMIYSDYYGVIPNDLSYYIKLSKKFLNDMDAPKGKALIYHRAMCQH